METNELVLIISNQYGEHTRISGTRKDILKELRQIALDKRKGSRQAHHLPTDVMALGATHKTGDELVDMATFDIKQRGIAELLDLLNAHGVEKYALKHPDAILLYRCGDFYEAVGEDAKAVSDILGIILTKKGNTTMAGFPHQSLDQYLPKLVRAGRRVVILDAPSAAQESAPEVEQTQEPCALADNIKAVMAEHGITQRELAKKLGTHPVVVNNTIHNPNVKVSTLQRYADAIGCTVGDFFNR